MNLERIHTEQDKIILNSSQGQEMRNSIIMNGSETIKQLIYGNNHKIGDIPSLNCETADTCTSAELGYCKLCDICYAKADLRYDGHRARMERGAIFYSLLKSSNIVFHLFNDYLKYYNIPVIRFNIVGDFKDSSDVGLIKTLAIENPQTKFYGYTKRRDLKSELINLSKVPNVYLNVDNARTCPAVQSNSFDVVTDISDWFMSNNKCLGDCNMCRKCYTLKGEYIACFIHSSPSKLQKWINTKENWNFMSGLCQQYMGFALPDFESRSGLFCVKINRELENQGINVPYTLTKKGNKSYYLNTVPKLVKFIKKYERFQLLPPIIKGGD